MKGSLSFSKYDAAEHLLSLRQVLANLEVLEDTTQRYDFKKVIEAVVYLIEKEVM